jgi:1-acyl-sn-glycerol-3-phosphate acyltransferase
MRIRWLVSWVLTFPIFRLLTGVEIRGRIPRHGALILASNHRSFLDPPLIGYTAFREIYFLAKPSLFALSKFFRELIRAYNALALEGTEGVRAAVKLLKKGNAVVIFPEGTRAKGGTFMPFNPGVGYLSITYNVPVVPVCIVNSNKNWFTLILRINNLRISYGRAILPTGYQKTRDDFERFAVKVREEVMKLS